LLTYCPKCKTDMDIDEYRSRDLCAVCNCDLNFLRYKTVATMCILGAGLPWLGLLKFPYEEMAVGWVMTAVFVSALSIEIGGDLLLRLVGIPKLRRRAIVEPLGLIVPIAVAIAMPRLMAPFLHR